MTEMPSEFTFSFWVYPMSINAESYFIHAFERVQIYAQSSLDLFFKFKTSATPSYVQPDYSVFNQNQIQLNTWNYVTASLRTFL